MILKSVGLIQSQKLQLLSAERFKVVSLVWKMCEISNYRIMFQGNMYIHLLTITILLKNPKIPKKELKFLPKLT